MKKLFQVKPVDKKFYEEKIRDILPDRIIDVHTHIWLKSMKNRPGQEKRVVNWPSRVAEENPAADLIQTYKLLLPGKTVTPLIFNSPTRGKNLDILNGYVTRSAKKYKLPSLMLSNPAWPGEDFAQKLKDGNFQGAKPYLSFASEYIPPDEIRIFDFIPHHHLEVLNRLGKILMLHIPRPGRLKDRVNLAQMLEIEEKYPDIKLIIAHAGRAYCPEDVGDAFKVLSCTKKMSFDISANTNETVFRQLIEAVGPQRILFGSDLPITRMRMRRICEKGIYINLIPGGLYGDVSGDKNMREVTGKEAEKLSFFLYEEISAFCRAAEKTGLTKRDIQKVFYSNAAALLKHSATAPLKKQLHMILPEKILKKPPVYKLPRGYTIRTYRGGDEKHYVKLMRSAGFEKWDNTGDVLKTTLPGGIFFVVHNASGKIVATACANHKPVSLHPRGGELGWVAVNPEHRGKKLGCIVCSAVINRFIKAGYRRIYLATDDFRLAAIKIYLNMGFVPFPYSDDMKERWMKVKKELS